MSPPTLPPILPPTLPPTVTPARVPARPPAHQPTGAGRPGMPSPAPMRRRSARRRRLRSIWSMMLGAIVFAGFAAVVVFLVIVAAGRLQQHDEAARLATVPPASVDISAVIEQADRPVPQREATAPGASAVASAAPVPVAMMRTPDGGEVRTVTYAGMLAGGGDVSLILRDAVVVAAPGSVVSTDTTSLRTAAAFSAVVEHDGRRTYATCVAVQVDVSCVTGWQPDGRMPSMFLEQLAALPIR